MKNLINRNTLYMGGWVLASSVATAAISMYLLQQVAKSIDLEGQQIQFDVAYFLYLILFFGVSVLSHFFRSKYSSRAVTDIRNVTVKKISNSSFSLLEATGKARVYNILIEDVDRISRVFANVPHVIHSFAATLIAVIYLFTLSPYLFLFIVVTIVINVIFSRFYFFLATSVGDHLREERSLATELYRGLIYGKKELSLNSVRTKHYLLNRLFPNIEKMRELQQRNQFLWGMNTCVSNASLFLLYGALIYFGQESDRAVLVQFIVVTMYLSSNFNELVSFIEVVSNGLISLKRVNNLGVSNDSSFEPDDELSVGGGEWGTLELKKAVCGYKNEFEKGFEIGPINFSLVKNEVLFVTGGNGSGKSSFVKMILGLLPLKSGEIALNGRAVTDETIDEYQSKFHAIHSDMYLFSDLLDKCGGMSNFDTVAKYLDYFDLSEKVEVTNGAFSKLNLSQGQRKRLALISAIVEDREILVLDEWAADQDPQFREEFYERFIPNLQKQGKTIILVSHDDRYFHIADRVLKFEFGKIVETY